MLSSKLIEQLISAGLTKQQATSVTAEAVTNFLMNEDGKKLIQEAQWQVSEMQALVNELKSSYVELQKKIADVSQELLSIIKAQAEYGGVTDEKAKNVVALYAALLKMNEDTGAKPADIVNNAGYVVYAYLGGQAKQNIRYTNQEENDTRNVY